MIFSIVGGEILCRYGDTESMCDVLGVAPDSIRIEELVGDLHGCYSSLW